MELTLELDMDPQAPGMVTPEQDTVLASKEG
jgi:hypothetical protein